MSLPSCNGSVTLALLADEAVALGDAALDGDFDEARFRAERIALVAGAHPPVAAAARALAVLLGPAGTVPPHGYGRGMCRLVEALAALPPLPHPQHAACLPPRTCPSRPPSPPVPDPLHPQVLP